MLSFQKLWNKYPTVTDGFEGIKPCKNSMGMSNFIHQCAIRLGTALYRAGVKFYSYPAGGRCWYKGHQGHTLRAWVDDKTALGYIGSGKEIQKSLLS